MQKETRIRYQQIAKEIRKFLDTGDHKYKQPEKSFIDWFVFARFGSLNGLTLLDGKRDGGLDAIVENNGVTYVFQSKYDTTTKVSLLSRNDVAAFDSIAKKFKDTKSSDDYIQWLNTVRPEIRKHYNKVKQKAEDTPRAVRFIFITTKFSNYEAEEHFEIEDIRQISPLWQLYAEGFTPPTESIEITLESVWNTTSNKDLITYVGIADVKEFISLMKKDENERLFAQNVRTNLRSNVNTMIRETYEKEPSTFWLGNNGVYIVAKKVTVISGRTYKLTYPSVINGSQTLHSIFDSQKSHSCKILVRILEMDVLGDPKSLDKIIRRTNTQNAMKLTNLYAHESVQLNIARYLNRYKIFYERREKEWLNEKKVIFDGYMPVKLKDVTQWLSTMYPTIGLGTARSQVSKLFEPYNYGLIFSSFDQNFQAKIYLDLASLVWIGLFLRFVMREIPRTTKSYATISHLLLTKVLHQAIRNSQKLETKIDSLLFEHRFGRKNLPKQITTSIKNIVGSTVGIQKKAQLIDQNLDYSNFFKRDDKVELALSKINSTKEIKNLTRALERYSEKIR